MSSNFEISSNLSLSPRGLPPSSYPTIQAPEPARKALQDCIARVETVITQVKLEMLRGHLSKLDCPITLGFPQDPVLTQCCGKIYDQSAIEQWKGLYNTCPVCRSEPVKWTPIRALREFVEDRLPKELVLTCSNFKGLNQPRAAQCFELAKNCIDELDYEGALAFLAQALKCTNASVDYAAVPGLYDQLGIPKKAQLTRLFLSLYQLQEGKTQEAIETLKHCESQGLNVGALIVGLTLQLRQDPEAVEWAMTRASSRVELSDRIFIYRQIIAHAPEQFQAYMKLIPLIKDWAEKRALLLEAAEVADKTGQFSLAGVLRKNADIPPAPTTISEGEWAASQTINLPPYPLELICFLASECTIWPGKKRSETHIVVPLFPKVVIDGVTLPLNLESLDQLDKSSGGPGYRYLWDQIPKNIPADNEFHYAVMTSDVLPGSRNKSYNDQEGLLPPGYEVPGVFDAARAILWENRRSGKRCFNDNPWTYTRCKEIIQGYQLSVGGFAPSGLYVCDDVYGGHEAFGVAGWRKF
jgi:hypothetical protein